MFCNILMDVPLKCRISLGEVVKDISSKIDNGTSKILIVAPSHEIADILLYRLGQKEMAKCEVRTYTPEEYLSYRQKHLLHEEKRIKEKTRRYFTPKKDLLQVPEILEIDLYWAELT